MGVFGTGLNSTDAVSGRKGARCLQRVISRERR